MGGRDGTDGCVRGRGVAWSMGWLEREGILGCSSEIHPTEERNAPEMEKEWMLTCGRIRWIRQSMPRDNACTCHPSTQPRRTDNIPGHPIPHFQALGFLPIPSQDAATYVQHGKKENFQRRPIFRHCQPMREEWKACHQPTNQQTNMWQWADHQAEANRKANGDIAPDEAYHCKGNQEGTLTV